MPANTFNWWLAHVSLVWASRIASWADFMERVLLLRHREGRDGCHIRPPGTFELTSHNVCTGSSFLGRVAIYFAYEIANVFVEWINMRGWTEES